VLRIERPLCPGSITTSGAVGVRLGVALDVGEGDGVRTVVLGVAEGVAAPDGVRLGAGVLGSGENTVRGGAGSGGLACGSEEPQPAMATTSAARTSVDRAAIAV